MWNTAGLASPYLASVCSCVYKCEYLKSLLHSLQTLPTPKTYAQLSDNTTLEFLYHQLKSEVVETPLCMGHAARVQKRKRERERREMCMDYYITIHYSAQTCSGIYVGLKRLAWRVN